MNTKNGLDTSFLLLMFRFVLQEIDRRKYSIFRFHVIGPVGVNFCKTHLFSAFYLKKKKYR
jgi:hypothetical protein